MSFREKAVQNFKYRKIYGTEMPDKLPMKLYILEHLLPRVKDDSIYRKINAKYLKLIKL